MAAATSASGALSLTPIPMPPTADPLGPPATCDLTVSCTIPTLAAGETYADLLTDRSAFEDFDADAVGAKGIGYVQLDQLALEHVLGAR